MVQQKLTKSEFKKGAENIILELDKYKRNSYFTHNIHPYPAKFIPQIPRELILRLSKKDDWVLDPFCGSGTTLVEAKLTCRNSIGVDVNPLSCLISKVKVTSLSLDNISEIKKVLFIIKRDILRNVKFEQPEYPNIDLWFSEKAKNSLSVIRHYLNAIEYGSVKEFLSVAFSSIVVKASNQESDTSYRSIKKNLNEEQIWNMFAKKVNDMLIRIRDFQSTACPTISEIYNHDSRNLSFIQKKIDLIVTSPPYLNSYDYYLYHKHRMLWLSMDVSTTQEFEFGSRNKHNDKHESLSDYLKSLKKVVSSASMKLKEGGYFSLVTGDGILRGELIKMNREMDQLFDEIGYRKLREIRFNQRKYTRSFTKNMKKIEKESYILVYRY